jgi:hypothetical protein
MQLAQPAEATLNAYKRLHELIIGRCGLDWNSSAGAELAAGGADRNMNRHIPRRGRAAAGRLGRTRRIPSPASAGVDRLMEGHRMNPLLFEQDVRRELVARVRQEIQAGTYDTPDKLEAALDCLAGRFNDD